MVCLVRVMRVVAGVFGEGVGFVGGCFVWMFVCK